MKDYNEYAQELYDEYGDMHSGESPILEFKDELTYIVRAKATYYPEFVDIFVPLDPYEKNQPRPKSSRIKREPTDEEIEQTKEENQESSLRRTKRKVSDYILCNNFEIFATFTFKDDRQNIDRCKSKMQDWLDNQKKRYGKFQYIIVPEFHKDGKSLHFHALIMNYSGQLERAVNPNTGKFVKKGGRDVYTFPGYQSGFSNARKIDSDPESRAKLANYLGKYITKDMPLFPGKKRYWNSRDLSVPIIEDNPSNWYLDKEPIHSYEIKFGTMYRYDITDYWTEYMTDFFSQGKNQG